MRQAVSAAWRQVVEKVAAATFSSRGFAFFAVSTSASHGKPLLATLGKCKHLLSLVGVSASLMLTAAKNVRNGFGLSTIAENGAGYACPLQAMACAIRASPDS